jgi:hypothetical protein
MCGTLFRRVPPAAAVTTLPTAFANCGLDGIDPSFLKPAAAGLQCGEPRGPTPAGLASGMR